MKIPACNWEKRSWKQRNRAGSREDRMLSEIEVCIPPRISELTATIEQSVLSKIEEAMHEVISLEASSAEQLTALSSLLLRTESVASSKIERVEASIDDYARAFYGSKQNASAVDMVAGTHAFQQFIRGVDQTGKISQSGLKTAQEMVVSTDLEESRSAGRYRQEQNWIEGSDFSPRGAIFIPPPPELVLPLMEDLEHFSNRSDLNVVFQAAVSHAQFETIHPFTDGNGRVGRALINGVFRRRQLTNRIVVPLASALVANRDGYFDQLSEYRLGNPLPLIQEFTAGTFIAARESKTTAENLSSIPQIWRSRLSRIRRGSATDVILDSLLASPVITADEFINSKGYAANSVYSSLERLLEADIIRPLTTRKRNQIWGASAVLDELEDLSLRIRVRARGGIK